jgi:hypothetical protein
MRVKESQLRSILRVKEKRGSDLLCYCPNCGKPEFGISISKDDNPWNCYRKKHCGISGNIRNLHKALNISYFEVTGIKGFGTTNSLKDWGGRKLESRVVDDWRWTILKERKLPVGFKRIFDDEYLRGRGFTDRHFQEYEVGRTNLIYNLKDRIIIGVKQNGVMVSYISRSLLSKEECELNDIKRYLNSKDEFDKIIAGIDEVKGQKSGIIVEGLFDKSNIDSELSLPDDNLVCLCTFGAKITYDQIRMMQEKGIENIFLFLDPDVLKVIDKASRNLLNKFKDLKICFEGRSDNDAGGMNQEELLKQLLNSKNFINFDKNTIINNRLV